MPKHHERRVTTSDVQKATRPPFLNIWRVASGRASAAHGSGLRPARGQALRRLARTVQVRAGALLLAAAPSGRNAVPRGSGFGP